MFRKIWLTRAGLIPKTAAHSFWDRLFTRIYSRICSAKVCLYKALSTLGCLSAFRAANSDRFQGPECGFTLAQDEISVPLRNTTVILLS